MRFKLFAILLALLPMPALADVTAHYTSGKDVVTVEAEDGGNSRIGVDGKFSIIRRGGADYVVMTLPTGEAKVTELAELITMVEAMANGGKATPLADETFILEAKGEGALGERKGSLWSFGPKGTGTEKRRMIEVLISGDPALAPVGAVFHRTIETLAPVLAMIAPATTGFGPKAIELTAKGTPIRIERMIELQSVDTAKIDAKRFELPAPVISAIEWLESMQPGGDGSAIMPLP